MSDELTAPRDPGSYARRPSRRGAWVVVAFGLACLAAGYGLARFGPQLYPAKPAPGALERPQPLAAVQPLEPPAPIAPPDAPIERADADIEHRVDLLEADRGRLATAAAAVLAAGALADAAQSSRPFADEVKALARAAPGLDLRSLALDAERGAPTRAALAASFPDYAAKAASAARAPGDGAGVLERVGYALSRVVALRRVGEVPGNSADARLARAEQQMQDGDVAAALKTLEALPAAAKDALGPWRDRAERRAKLDRDIAAVRAQAMEELGRLSQAGT